MTTTTPDTTEVVTQFSIDERDDDSLIAERDWQFGWRCIARRPKLMTNAEWRPIAERIVAAMSRPTIAGVPDGLVEGAVRIAVWNACKARGVGDDSIYQIITAVLAEPTLAALSARPSPPKVDATGWIVATGDGKCFRAWQGGCPCWTDDRNEAIRYARRSDAEAAHEEDADAWRIQPFASTTRGAEDTQAEVVRS